MVHLAALSLLFHLELPLGYGATNLALLGLVAEGADFIHVCSTEGGLVVGVELVVDVTASNTALAHCHVAQQDYFSCHLLLGFGFAFHV